MIVILNQAAGTSAATENIENKVREAFTRLGAEVQIIRPDETNDLSKIARAAAGGAEPLIVAGGGDGTISGVAAALAGTGKTLGVLPLGTLNHFAKDLGISLELPAAVETIMHGRITEVDVGEVNGRVFINNSSLGLYPHIVANREVQQERLARSKWAAFFWATLRIFRRFPFLDLRIKLEGKQLVRRTAFLFIGNNPYEIAGFSLGARARLDSGQLGLYLTHRTGRFGLLRLGLHALFGRVHQADDFDAFRVEEATIETRHSRLLVATDGEVAPMETPLCYKIRPAALRVMVPGSAQPK